MQFKFWTPWKLIFKLNSTTLLNDLETNEILIFDGDKDIEKEYKKKLEELRIV